MTKIPSGNSFLNPQRILHDLGLKPGDKVADLGCGGAAYFVLQAAKIVGNRGVVYGVDVLKSALSGLKSRLALHGITNVVPVWSNVEVYKGAKRIKDNSLDYSMIINTLFQSKDKPAMLREAIRITAHGGRLVIIDWKTGGLTFGPNVNQLVSPQGVQNIVVGQHHLTLQRVFEPGPYHFGLVFVKE